MTGFPARTLRIRHYREEERLSRAALLFHRTPLQLFHCHAIFNQVHCQLDKQIGILTGMNWLDPKNTPAEIMM